MCRYTPFRRNSNRRLYCPGTASCAREAAPATFACQSSLLTQSSALIAHSGQRVSRLLSLPPRSIRGIEAESRAVCPPLTAAFFCLVAKFTAQSVPPQRRWANVQRPCVATVPVGAVGGRGRLSTRRRLSNVEAGWRPYGHPIVLSSSRHPCISDSDGSLPAAPYVAARTKLVDTAGAGP